MAKNWRQVAEMLAERLVVHAFCDKHSTRNPAPECPFCSDCAAYQAYLAGRDFTLHVPGEPVPIQDLSPSDALVRASGRTTSDGRRGHD